ncbi:uncharacterized protein [Dermacentor andersoni]|uniref:uncharacterized protein isoform X2 n=1 Tax=Dermacentor andersoni TaxID=34620 RepID=UPI002417046D|nr:uncharacterized protein LOC126529268 isoform X2 [Dermacentor andersoni]
MVLLLMIVLFTTYVSQITASGDKNQRSPTAHKESDGKSLVPQIALQKVMRFVQTDEEIHLQMIDLEDWINLRCECVKSRFQARHTDGCERTMHCYTWVKVSEGWVDFQVTSIRGMTSVDLKTIVGIEPTDDAPEEFPHTYLVLKAQRNCLLVSYGQSSNGTQRCLLWGLSGSHVSKQTQCYKALNSFCAPDIYDMTETASSCQQYDLNEDT